MRDFLERFIHHFPKVLVLEIIGLVALVLVHTYSTWLDFPPDAEGVPRAAPPPGSLAGPSPSARRSQGSTAADSGLAVCPGTDYHGCVCHPAGCTLAPASAWLIQPKSVELREPATTVALRITDGGGEGRAVSTSGAAGTELAFSQEAAPELRYPASTFKSGIRLTVRFDERGDERDVTVLQSKSIKAGSVFEEGLALHSVDPKSRLKTLVVYLRPDSGSAQRVSAPPGSSGAPRPAAREPAGAEAGAERASAEEGEVAIVDLTPSAWPGGMYGSPALARIAILYFVVVLFLGMWVAAEDIRKRTLVDSLRRVFTIVLGLLFHAAVAPLAAGALLSLLWTLVSYAFTAQASAFKLSFVWFCVFSALTFFVAILFVRDVRKVRRAAPTDAWGRIARRGAVVFTIVGNVFLVKDIVKLLLESASSLP